MARYFNIRQSDGLVVDSIIWDGISPWQPDEGFIVLLESDHPDVSQGWRKVSGGWESPPTGMHYWNGTEWIDGSSNGDN